MFMISSTDSLSAHLYCFHTATAKDFRSIKAVIIMDHNVSICKTLTKQMSLGNRSKDEAVYLAPF